MHFDNANYIYIYIYMKYLRGKETNTLRLVGEHVFILLSVAEAHSDPSFSSALKIASTESREKISWICFQFEEIALGSDDNVRGR